MNKLFSFSFRTSFLSALLLVFILNLPGRAEQPSAVLQERFKASVNTMVQQVQTAQDPVAKREILGNFLTRMDQRLGMVRGLIPEQDRAGLDVIRTKVESQYAELNGLNGKEKVTDADLNPFARYIQQDMEQSDAYWTGGGLYISAGLLIFILVILLILR